MDIVAARAGAGKATIYWRWTSKSDLVIDGVARTKRNQSISITCKLKIMTGLTSLLSQEAALADAANTAVVQPRTEAHLALMQRAVERGEILATADIGTLSQVLPSMAASPEPVPQPHSESF